MTDIVIDYLRKCLGFNWLTGPVFDKELRVSSRRRRNYVLRFAYISLMMIILLFIWIISVDYRNSSVIQVSRLAQAGKYIVAYIVSFQFCAAQIIAVVMLSNSISDEIYHKTLGMLMVTPITSLQIVMGKMLSKLLQLLLLLAISLPLLAIVRVFGGVPWDFITSSLCLTITTVIFVGALSLFFSIFCRRAYVVIMVTITSLLCLFALVPFLVATISYLTKMGHDNELGMLFINSNPYVGFIFNTMTLIEPRGAAVPFFISPYINCIVNLFLSIVLLFLSVLLVRKVAIRQATGQLLPFRQKKNSQNNSKKYENINNSAIISVIGPPVLWKELILPLRRNVKIYRILGIILFLALLTYSYWFFYKIQAYGQEETHLLYALIFMGLGTLRLAVLSSTSITSEKESSSWILLLTSTLGDWQIVFGKLLGILSHCLPIWSFLLGHVILFYLLGFIHPMAILLTSILLTWFIILISCSGLYFSSLFKHTTTSVIMNFVFILFLWGFIPLVFGIVSAIMSDGDFVEVCLFFNPFIQIIVIIISSMMSHLYIESGIMHYSWPYGNESIHNTLFIFGISFCIYMIMGLVFLWRAKKRLRKKVF